MAICYKIKDEYNKKVYEESMEWTNFTTKENTGTVTQPNHISSGGGGSGMPFVVKQKTVEEQITVINVEGVFSILQNYPEILLGIFGLVFTFQFFKFFRIIK